MMKSTIPNEDAADACPKCGGPMTIARSHARWSPDKSRGCRDLAGRAASNARRGAPTGMKLARALRAAFGYRWFELEEGLPIAVKFGRDRHRFEAFLNEMGEGDFDPRTNKGSPGDGVLVERIIGTITTSDSTSSPSPTEPSPSHPPRRAEASPQSCPTSRLLGDERRAASVQVGLPLAKSPDLIGLRKKTRPEGLSTVDVTKLIERISPDLDEARERGDVLFRVSVTMPPWNWAGATQAAHVFRDALRRLSASAVLLARDRSKTGAPHWYGIVAVPEDQDRKAVRALVESAWMAASGAHSGCIRVVAVTAWRAFVESDGDLDARVGPHTLRANLARVLAYAFKPSPIQHGTRDLIADVVEDGSFFGATLACAA